MDKELFLEAVKKAAADLRKRECSLRESARARLDSAECLRSATSSDLSEGRRLAERMTGRKLTFSVSEKESADFQESIARKLINEADKIGRLCEILEASK